MPVLWWVGDYIDKRTIMRANRNNYEVSINAITSEFWVKKAFDSTVRFETNISKLDSYILEHSPTRVEEYFIELKNIPTFVSVHFVRHKIGVEHFVLSNRNDRGGDDDVDRWTPVNHSMKINAEALINLARKRLCLTSHEETVYIMNMIKEEMTKVNYNLGQMLIPNCVYRNGLCKEIKSKKKCLKGMMKKYPYYKDLFITE